MQSYANWISTHRLSVFIVVGDVSEVFTTLSVHGIGEAGVVSVQLRSVGQNLVGESVELADASREPRNDFRLIVGHFLIIVISSRDDLEVAALVFQQFDRIGQLLVETRVAFNHKFIA